MPCGAAGYSGDMSGDGSAGRVGNGGAVVDDSSGSGHFGVGGSCANGGGDGGSGGDGGDYSGRVGCRIGAVDGVGDSDGECVRRCI